eukprot:CAMPEP_0198319162 /NCGR_PEP_ID=MMETSP1450-20131203/8362_1 /TAXON_ID=753684 ORGANISM="Madagascaria erythrocladiodes, Strain CCMP3234" /NCGR_SAMPLE_ID=MMETSP1450 /ASSEMBLY_ACC=CAM_ASM_001115 /LENGTH=165 /DNA_ID=CAMNT_0044022519 /DNA_START=66 /DNA_END=558 /DNA_ORIENTATION=-
MTSAAASAEQVAVHARAVAKERLADAAVDEVRAEQVEARVGVAREALAVHNAATVGLRRVEGAREVLQAREAAPRHVVAVLQQHRAAPRRVVDGELPPHAAHPAVEAAEVLAHDVEHVVERGADRGARERRHATRQHGAAARGVGERLVEQRGGGGVQRLAALAL